jgi:hypothetical protein
MKDKKIKMIKTMNVEDIYVKLYALGDAYQCLLKAEYDDEPFINDVTLCGLDRLFTDAMIELELILFGERYTDHDPDIESFEELPNEDKTASQAQS